MPRAMRTPRPAREQAESVEEQVARIGRMSIGELRELWKESYDSEPPASFSKDLLARAIAYRLQKEAYGGLSAATTRLLKSLAKPGAEPPRRVKVGSVVIRQHKGVLHEVMVVPGGFCWRGETYDSLSTIARKITGVSWNGPRFFGLRSKKDMLSESPEAAQASSALEQTGPSPKGKTKGASRKEESASRARRRSSIRTGGRWR